MKQLCRAISYDLYFGILRKWPIYLPAVLWGVYIAWRVDAACLAGQAMGFVAQGATFTFADVLLYAFGGMAEYIPVAGQPFEIPVEWLLWFVYTVLVSSQYPYKHLCGIGQQQLFRFRNRQFWWIGKCVWGICNTITVYGCFLAAALVYTGWRGNITATISLWMGDLLSFLILPDTAAFGWSKLLTLMAITVLVSIVFTQWQTTLILFTSPLGAFLAVTVVLAAGAYALTPLLPGNFAMWVRSEWLLADGLPVLCGILLCGVYYVIAFMIGAIRFSRYDVINIQE